VRGPPPVPRERSREDLDRPWGAVPMSPPSTFSGGDLRVTGLTQAHQVLGRVSAALRQGLDVVYFRGGCEPSIFFTLLAKRMGGNVSVPDSLPCPTIPFLDGRVAVILFIAFGFLFGMFITEPSFRKLGTARVGARPLGFEGHWVTSFLANKKPPRVSP